MCSKTVPSANVPFVCDLKSSVSCKGDEVVSKNTALEISLDILPYHEVSADQVFVHIHDNGRRLRRRAHHHGLLAHHAHALYEQLFRCVRALGLDADYATQSAVHPFSLRNTIRRTEEAVARARA